MNGRNPLIAATGLLALLAAAGVLDGTTGLLMVAPFSVLMGFLLVGHYPGERVLIELTRAMSARRRIIRPVSLVLPALPKFLGQSVAVECNGSRGPPRFV